MIAGQDRDFGITGQIVPGGKPTACLDGSSVIISCLPVLEGIPVKIRIIR